MRFDELPSELIMAVLNRTDFQTTMKLSRTNSRIYKISRHNKYVNMMRFDRLPGKLVLSVLQAAGPLTRSKLARTNSRIHQIMKENHLDQVKAATISFEQIRSGPHIQLICDVYYLLWGHTYLRTFVELEKPEDLVGKMRQILSLIKSVDSVTFTGVVIDETYPSMLKECYFEWKDVNVEFINCRYENISKEELLSLWKISEKVIDVDGKLEGESANFIDDQMLFELHQTFTLRTFQVGREVFDNNNLITDETLKFLAENRKDYLALDGYITSYTAKEVKKLFMKIVRSRCSLVEEWCIGSIALDLDSYNQIIKEFKYFNTRTSTFTEDRNWSEHATLLKVTYKKKDSESFASLSVGLIKPVELLFEDESLLNDLRALHIQPTPEPQDIDSEMPEYFQRKRTYKDL